MGPYAPVINKALLPYEGKAILSHIMDGFPRGTKFVIALGHRGDQVRDYLTAAHPDDDITYVTVDNYDKPGSGPGYSIYCCREFLQQPFYFVAADTVATFDVRTGTDGNWAGVAMVAPIESARLCNFTVGEMGFIDKIYDKQIPPGKDSVAGFVGLMFIRDYGLFWHALATPETVAGEVQISAGLKALVAAGTLRAREVGWKDFGILSDYRKYAIEPQPYDFSKTDEFIYFRAGRVIKFFSDARAAANRVEKAALYPGVMPHCEQIGEQFYFYEKIPGTVVYEQVTTDVFAQMLNWLHHQVWRPPGPHDPARFATACHNFYVNKTRTRTEKFREKYPEWEDPHTVNGEAVLPIAELLQIIPPAYVNDGVARFIHGDLHFDNTIYDGEKFTLIDWRQDFGGEIAFGDWYYDLAKLLGGIWLNYDYIKHGLMHVTEKEAEIEIDFARRVQSLQYEAMLRDYVTAQKLDWRRVQTIVGLIYLNMAPLHTAPFDKLCYALAQQTLTRALAS